MYTLIVITHLFLCVFLIFVVLIQAGKSDMGSAFGGSGSQAVLTPASGTTLLGKITATVATMFMVTSFTLAWYTNHESGDTMIDGDVIEDVERELEAEKPVVVDPAPVAPAPEAPVEDAAPAGDAAPAPAGDEDLGSDGDDEDIPD